MGYDNQKSVWVIGYGRVMGYQYEIPAYRLGKLKNLCVIKEYGLNGVWVISESTVIGEQWRLPGVPSLLISKWSRRSVEVDLLRSHTNCRLLRPFPLRKLTAMGFQSLPELLVNIFGTYGVVGFVATIIVIAKLSQGPNVSMT